MTAPTEAVPRRWRVPRPRMPRGLRGMPRGTPRVVARARGLDPWVRTRLEPLVSAFRAATDIVTRRGWLAIGAGVAATGIGLWQGWVEFLILGIALLATAGLAVSWTFGRMAYAATIELDATRVVEGEQAFGRVVVRNRGGRTLLPSLIELPVGRRSRRFELPSLAGETDHEILFAVPTRRRGVITIGPLRSVKVDPFGLYRRERNWTERATLFVHPRTVPVGAQATGFLRDIEGVTSHNLTSSDVAFHALREYVPGDDLRTVHWRTTARTGRLMVRQFEETRRSHLLIALSLRRTDYAAAAELDAAVSTVGSLVKQARREERQVDVVTSAERLSVASAAILLDQLCSAEVQDEAPPLRETIAEALVAAPGISMIILVSGSAASAEDWHGAHRQAPLDAFVAGLRMTGANGTAARRRLGGMVVVDVPALGDLPRAVRVMR